MKLLLVVFCTLLYNNQGIVFYGKSISFKKNHSDLLELEDRLKSRYGYVPDFEDEEDEEEEKEGKILAPVPDSSFNEDNLFDESMSLKQLGFSDACLATLASGGMSLDLMIAASFSFPEQWLNRQQEFKQQEQLVVDKIVAFEGRNFLSDDKQEELESPKPSISLIKISETEFECLPGYMKGIATWEEEIKEMEREQIREGIDEFGILYSELSDSNRSKGSNGSFAFPV
ncbi:hypothetical protein HN873_039705 [Arachis hypogaea]